MFTECKFYIVPIINRVKILYLCELDDLFFPSLIDDFSGGFSFYTVDVDNFFHAMRSFSGKNMYFCEMQKTSSNINCLEIREMKKSIGIDLGTTNSVIAFKDTTLKIIRNKENEELTRSCVGIKNNEILVGRTAYQLIERDPINTILSVKRLMGGAINDKMVQDMIKSPYYKYTIKALRGGTDDSVAVVLGDREYTPEQISAEILKKLKADAEERLDCEVTDAVITVPAYFTEKQKNATKIAAQLAGLNVKKLLAEPTAAAIAYGVDNMKPGETKTVLIYDFGGGTFDLSILNIADGQYIEAGTGGDRWLGGDDIDRKLQEIIIDKVQKQNNIFSLESLIDRLPNKKKYLFEGQMKQKAREAKVQLSSSQTASIIIDGILEDEYGDLIDIDVTIYREEFEEKISPLIERSIDLIDKLINEVGYDINIIDSILLVGGTSCIPMVKRRLVEKFGQEKVKMSDKAMLVVAEGAAILAHHLGQTYEITEDTVPAITEISYSTNHNYFIELKEDFDRIIEKQMPLPFNVVRSYKTTMDKQKIVKVGIYADVEYGRKETQAIGFFTIDDDLPLGSEVVFEVTLGIDEIFDIKAYLKSNLSGKKAIVLGRGNKDSRALEFISNSLEKMLNKNYSEAQREYFFNAVQKEIEKINSMRIESIHPERWEQISSNVFTAFEKAEKVTEEVDEKRLVALFAQILLNEYTDLIGSFNVSALQELLLEMEENDPLTKMQAAQKLKKMTDEFSTLILLFTLKIASEHAAKINPDDANKLLQMHDTIIRYFKQGRGRDGENLLNEAIGMRDKYDFNDIITRSIHVSKKIAYDEF